LCTVVAFVVTFYEGVAAGFRFFAIIFTAIEIVSVAVVALFHGSLVLDVVAAVRNLACRGAVVTVDVVAVVALLALVGAVDVVTTFIDCALG